MLTTASSSKLSLPNPSGHFRLPKPRTASLEVLHLLRHLLRAATYLPDPFARTQAHSHILHRFRKDVPTPVRLKDARLAISTLQRAAEGEKRPLMRVLLDVYGRSGPRRRQLLAQVYHSSQPLYKPASTQSYKFNEDIDAAIAAGATSDSALSVAETHPALWALLRSHQQHPVENSPRVRLKFIDPEHAPDVPKTNIFGRPLARKAAAGKRRRFWARVLNKVLPPLPEVEWFRLQDLATGAVSWEGPIPRRRIGLSSAEIILRNSHLDTAERSGSHLETDAAAAAAAAATESNMKDTRTGDGRLPVHLEPLTVTPDASVASSTASRLLGHPLRSSRIRVSERIPGSNEVLMLESAPRAMHKHFLTPRHMRRNWAYIWSISPMMTFDVTSSKWKVQWGSTRASPVTEKVSGMKNTELWE